LEDTTPKNRFNPFSIAELTALEYAIHHFINCADICDIAIVVLQELQDEIQSEFTARGIKR
jgi:hypothetical protein